MVIYPAVVMAFLATRVYPTDASNEDLLLTGDLHKVFEDSKTIKPFSIDDMETAVIVTGLCVGQFGCDKASQAFTTEHPELQLSADRFVEKAKDVAGPIATHTVEYTLPIYMLATGHSGTIIINKYWSFTGSIAAQSMSVNFGF